MPPPRAESPSLIFCFFSSLSPHHHRCADFLTFRATRAVPQSFAHLCRYVKASSLLLLLLCLLLVSVRWSTIPLSTLPHCIWVNPRGMHMAVRSIFSLFKCHSAHAPLGAPKLPFHTTTSPVQHISTGKCCCAEPVADPTLVLPLPALCHGLASCLFIETNALLRLQILSCQQASTHRVPLLPSICHSPEPAFHHRYWTSATRTTHMIH